MQQYKVHMSGGRRPPLVEERQLTGRPVQPWETRVRRRSVDIHLGKWVNTYINTHSGASPRKTRLRTTAALSLGNCWQHYNAHGKNDVLVFMTFGKPWRFLCISSIRQRVQKLNTSSCRTQLDVNWCANIRRFIYVLITALKKQSCYLMPFKGVSEIVPLERCCCPPKVLFLIQIVPLQRH